MILLIDNYDSFTYNLYHYLAELGAEVRVALNDRIDADGVEELKPDAIVVSPGPCTPNEAGVSCEVIRRFGERTPILGVCLGHQCIGAAVGARVVRAHEIMHGVTHFSVSRRTGERGGLLPNHRWVRGPSSFTVRYPSGATWTGRCGTRYRYNPGDCYVCGRAFYLACRDGRILLYMDHGGTIHESYSDGCGSFASMVQ
ncbi:MAG: hypothetical protein OXK20_09235, partial [Deltaproteobacteria bacterium]|nr:hypothetical protein [Deltaproteobacteria bacterium]